MSDDQSFYEIQLNTPHIALAGLGLAVVGVAIFWLGVVIGRGQSEAPVGTPPDWQAAASADGNEGAGEDPGDSMGSMDDAGEPASQATSEDDPPAQDDPPVVEDPEPENPPAADPDAFQPADPVDEQPDPIAATSTSASGLPIPDTSLVSGWIIQVRSTPEEAAANRLQTALAVAGYPAFVVSAEVEGQTYYRVRVGRYVSRADADIVEERLKTLPDVESTWVTEG